MTKEQDVCLTANGQFSSSIRSIRVISIFLHAFFIACTHASDVWEGSIYAFGIPHSAQS